MQNLFYMIEAYFDRVNAVWGTFVWYQILSFCFGIIVGAIAGMLLRATIECWKEESPKTNSIHLAMVISAVVLSIGLFFPFWTNGLFIMAVGLNLCCVLIGFGKLTAATLGTIGLLLMSIF